MNEFILVDNAIKFLLCKIERADRTDKIWSEQRKTELITELDEGGIDYEVIDFEQPIQEVLDKVEGKKFNTIAEAQMFLDGTLLKTDKERINDLELYILEMEEVI